MTLDRGDRLGRPEHLGKDEAPKGLEFLDPERDAHETECSEPDDRPEDELEQDFTEGVERRRREQKGGFGNLRDETRDKRGEDDLAGFPEKTPVIPFGNAFPEH